MNYLTNTFNIQTERRKNQMLTPSIQTIIDHSQNNVTMNNFKEFQQKLLLTLQNDVDNNLEELVNYNDFQATLFGLELVGEYHVNSNNEIDHIEINYIDNQLIN